MWLHNKKGGVGRWYLRFVPRWASQCVLCCHQDNDNDDEDNVVASSTIDWDVWPFVITDDLSRSLLVSNGSKKDLIFVLGWEYKIRRKGWQRHSLNLGQILCIVHMKRYRKMYHHNSGRGNGSGALGSIQPSWVLGVRRFWSGASNHVLAVSVVLGCANDTTIQGYCCHLSLSLSRSLYQKTTTLSEPFTTHTAVYRTFTYIFCL